MLNPHRLIVLIILLFSSACGQGQNEQSVDFIGKLVFEKYLILNADNPFDIPEDLYRLETIDTITYFLVSDSVVYSETVDIEGKIKGYRRKNMNLEEVFDMNTKLITNLMSSHNLPSSVKEKFRKTKIRKEVAGLNCTKFLYATNKDDEGTVYIADDFPYKISLNEEIRNISIPMHNEQLETESVIKSKITETLSWTRHLRLISFTYDPLIKIDHVKEIFGQK